MSRRERRNKLVGPWRNIHGAIWLIGLAILALTKWWWPGILVLVALSMVIEAILMQSVPQAFESDEPAVDPSLVISPSSPASPVPEHRPGLLPTSCPHCGGPIRGHEVKWTGAQSADCPYCGVNLPMGKG